MCFFVPAVAFGAPGDFPKPTGLATQVEFWKKVFAEYSENQVVVHDNLYLDKIYTVIDLRPLAASGADDETLRRERHRREQQEMDRVDEALGRLARGGVSPDDLSGLERDIWNLFKDVTGAQKFAEARDRVRTQQGLRERFRRGLEVSRRYLPQMEEIFRREGLAGGADAPPVRGVELQRACVFEGRCGGIWQFIPSSARIYLELNEVQDSRRDPIYATLGAAHHLRDDYAVLDSWPLAITAYNHGRAGVARAVERELDSSDIVTIIKRYQGKSFGFASRNFYTEFFAALEVERDYKDPLRRGEVRAAPAVPGGHDPRLPALLDGCQARGVQCRGAGDLNPASPTRSSRASSTCRRVTRSAFPPAEPKSSAPPTSICPPTERFSQQRRFFIAHRVTRGQTIGAIAKRYRTTVAAIQGANGLRDAKRLRAGQVLKIPTG